MLRYLPCIGFEHAPSKYISTTPNLEKRTTDWLWCHVQNVLWGRGVIPIFGKILLAPNLGKIPIWVKIARVN